MIEIVYNKEKESSVGNEEYFCVPRNIRQIGNPSSECKVYVEDYVHEFLSKNWKDADAKGKMAILLGKSNWKDGTFYLFVKSALWVEQIEGNREYLSLKDEVWGEIYEEMKEYFPEQDVIGWYLSFPTGGLKVTEMIKKIHLSHFGGNDKVLLLADLEEQDHAFYMYRNGRMEKQEGYYVFYEKNEAMQEYILGKNPKASVDYTGKPQDRAIHDFRKIIARKNAEKNEKNLDKTMSYFTTGAAVTAILLGAMWLQKNYEDGLLNQKIQVSSTNVAELEEQSERKEDKSGQLWEIETSDASISEIETIGEEKLSEAEPSDEVNVSNFDDKDVIDTAEIDSAIGEETLESAENKIEESMGLDEKKDEETIASGVISEYVVQQGDTLNSISLRYYGSIQNVKEICEKNNILQEDTIYPGQKILLP